MIDDLEKKTILYIGASEAYRFMRHIDYQYETQQIIVGSAADARNFMRDSDGIVLVGYQDTVFPNRDEYLEFLAATQNIGIPVAVVRRKDQEVPNDAGIELIVESSRPDSSREYVATIALKLKDFFKDHD